MNLRDMASGILQVNEAIRSRLMNALGFSHDGNRDLYAAFGYSKNPTIEELAAMYHRNDIAGRIVRAFPQATWCEAPVIRDERGSGLKPGEDEYSPFAESVDAFMTKNKVLPILERADRLASIGRFGVLFLGFDDADKLDKPLAAGKSRLLHMSPYMDTSITISQMETDTKNPRFGLPKLYNIGSSDTLGLMADRVTRPSLSVHHSRVIHIAELLDQDEVYGVPCLLPIFNRLKDIEKVVGGSAEMFWLTANRGIAFWADKEANLTPEEIEAMKEQADEFMHGLKRHIIGSGMNAQVLGSDNPTPKEVFDCLIALIAGAKGMPQRILLGNEAGQLASTQDGSNWADRIQERKTGFAGPFVLEPLIQKMIDTGNILQPEGQWWIEWPEHDGLSETDKATIASTKTAALVSYANSPNASFVVPPAEFRESILGMPASSEYEDELEGLEPSEEEELPEEDEQAEGVATNALGRIKKPLYAFRPVRNWKAIDKHYRKQGVETIGEAMHVPLCYSKLAVDWSELAETIDEELDGSLTIIDAKFRETNVLGKCALVLEFSSDDLQWRNSVMRWAGVVSDFDIYRPHVTISYDADLSNWKTIKPWTGPIVLDAEVFSEIESEIPDEEAE